MATISTRKSLGATTHLSSTEIVETILRCVESKPTAKESIRTAPSQWISDWMDNVFPTLPPVNRSVSKRCLGRLNDAREAARVGTLEEASGCLAEARLMAISDLLRPEIQVFLQAQLAASEAYVAYCYNDYEEAGVQLREALRQDAVLEAEFGYRLIFANRLHLVNNLIRVTALSGDIACALRLTRDVTLYLGRITDRVADFWCGDYLSALHPDMIAVASGQLFSEVALLMASIDYESACLFGSELFDNLAVQSVSTRWQNQCREWFEVKRTFLFDTSNTFLERCSSFVVKGQGDWPLLWTMALVDAVPVAMSEAPRVGALLRPAVLREVRNSKYVPGLFKGAKLRVRHGDAWTPGHDSALAKADEHNCE